MSSFDWVWWPKDPQWGNWNLLFDDGKANMARGLQEIDRSLYEAAWVDGARPGWTTFWTITFPLLRNTAVAVLLLNFIAAFQAYDEFVNILSAAGSTGNLSLARPPLVYLRQVAIDQQDYGRGSAGALILTAIIIFVTLVQGRLFGFGRKA
jgi:multiple sugar transport system permease protein